MTSKIERKSFKFDVTEVKELEKENGVKVGIVKGYAATYDRDRVNDIILRGAFSRTLSEHKARGNRAIRLFWNHNPNIMVGGIPLETVVEDNKGLFVQGEVNLEHSEGKNVYALARQGVLSDFSIGFIAKDFQYNKDGVREIKDIDLYEVSFVPEPANMGATVTEVKSVVPFGDLPLANNDMEWDSTVAIQRVKTLTNSEEAPSEGYRRAFVWFDSANSENFGAYKLPIADVVDGSLKAVPRAIFAAAAAVSGARGGVDIPDDERTSVIRHLERYYQKMGRESPFQKGLGISELRQMELADIENILREKADLDGKAARFITDAYVAAIKNSHSDNAEQKGNAKVSEDTQAAISDIIKELKSIKNNLNKKEK